MTIPEYRRHILDLCKQHKIELKLGDDFRSHVFKSMVQVGSSIQSPQDYASALHEIGHQMHRRNHMNSTITLIVNNAFNQNEQEIQQLANELAAWDWARRNALEWTDPMNEQFRLAFSSYIAGALNGHFNGDLAALLRAIKEFGLTMKEIRRPFGR